MKTTIRCYKHSLSDDPFMMFEVGSPEELISTLSDKLSWRDYPNDIWVKIGLDALLYYPMLNLFKDWNGVRFATISKERLAYYVMK